MKYPTLFKILLIMLFEFGFIKPSHSQYWAEHGATWHYQRNYVVPGTLSEGYLKVDKVGDTLLNGMTCDRLKLQDPLFCYGLMDTMITYFSADTVLFYDTTFQTFQILYDFGATPGESWSIVRPDYMDTDTITVYVDSVDIVSINGSNLRRLYVTYWAEFESLPGVSYSSTIIERIGDLQLMFNIMHEAGYACDESYIVGLRCYEDSILGQYFTGISPSCDYQAYTGIHELEANKLLIVPNPVSDFLSIQTTMKEPFTVWVKDLFGKSMGHYENQYQWSTDHLSTGVYIVTLTNEAAAVSTRIHVVH